MPLFTLRVPPRDGPCKTRGQDGFAISFPAGLFHPLLHAGLSRRTEAERVRLIVEPIDDDVDRADRTAALRRLHDGIERMKFFSRGPLPSRDELHGRD
jgi:hypothetical protein